MQNLYILITMQRSRDFPFTTYRVARVMIESLFIYLFLMCLFRQFLFLISPSPEKKKGVLLVNEAGKY